MFSRKAFSGLLYRLGTHSLSAKVPYTVPFINNVSFYLHGFCEIKTVAHEPFSDYIY